MRLIASHVSGELGDPAPTRVRTGKSDGAARHPRLRLLLAAGPGDVVGTFRHWREGRDDPGQVAVTYSGQFFDVCRQLGAIGYAIAHHPRRDRVRDGEFHVEHRPIPFIKSRSATLYHAGQLWSALRLIATAVRVRANMLVIYDGTCHWFPLRVLPWLGVKVVPSIHCTFWRKGARPPGTIGRAIRALNAPFWRHGAAAVLSASREITAQLDRLASDGHAPVIEFLPTYRQGMFPTECPPTAPPFRVLFVGRIEAFKGVFDLLEIAARLASAGRTDFEFDLCGDGPALPELTRKAAELNLATRFRLHGHCSRPVMREMFRNAHGVIAPTTTAFAEGFNQVVAEAILAGRPVITSTVCPALDYVRQGAVEVPPDDVAGYMSAIVRLADDKGLYEQKRRACEALAGQFYETSRGWSAALARAIAMEGALSESSLSRRLCGSHMTPG
jgi:glycogen(starch) synthase